MAEPLGQVVFKVPELGKMGYQLELQDQAREEKKRKERDTELYRTGGEKAYSDNIYKVQGRYKDDIQLLYQEYEKYGQAYESTGDASSLRQAKEISSQIKSKIDDYNTKIGVPINEAFKADASGWEGYVGNRDEFDANINNVLNPKDITGRKYDNGNLLYQINGEWVPESATPYGDSRPNANNTVFVRKATSLGSYVIPSYFENQHRYTSLNASSASAASVGVKKEFYFELESNPELRADAAVAYAISKKLLPSDKIDPVEMRRVIERYNNPKAPALGEDEGTFAEAANNFYANKLGVLAENRYNTAGKANSETLDDLVPTTEGDMTEGGVEEQPKKKVEGKSSILPEESEDNMPKLSPTAEEKQARAEARIDRLNPRQTQEPKQGQRQGPITPEEEVVRRVENVGETQLENVAESEEFERIPEAGITDTELTVNVDGKEKIVVKRTLPTLYTDNLLEFEGGVSTDAGDPAAAADRNKNAPIIGGKKAHTNKGVTYDKFESWAKSIGMPKSQYEDRFLNLTNAEALAVAENVAVTKGANNFKNPVLVGMFTQNAWGGGGVYGKTTYSAEYQATLSMLKANGIEPSNKFKITEKDAAKIEALFNKNPKQFLDDYFEAYIISHTRMSLLGVDEKGGAGFGKGAKVPIWMIYRNGWTDRANEFKEAIAKEIGVEYEPITPYNESRKYIKQGDKFVLVEERDGEFVPVGKTDWVDSYQPIN